MEESYLEHTERIFFELASEQRLAILFKLNEHSLKLAKIARDLGVTMQEVHRNVNRLTEAGIIDKDSSGSYFLTTFGNIVIKQISTFGFLSRNRSYFSEHILGDMPMKFIQRIGSLDNSEYISGFVAVVELWKKLYDSSSEYIYAMLPQIPFELIETVISKIKKDGIKFSYILPQDAVVPKKGFDLLKASGFQDLLKSGIAERRMIDKIATAVVLNERHATVLFPNSKGVTDMNSLFSGQDGDSDAGRLFHEWCLDFYRYNWYNSKSFDEKRLREV
jgi:predicted transcriptional regulator